MPLVKTSSLLGFINVHSANILSLGDFNEKNSKKIPQILLVSMVQVTLSFVAFLCQCMILRDIREGEERENSPCSGKG